MSIMKLSILVFFSVFISASHAQNQDKRNCIWHGPNEQAAVTQQADPPKQPCWYIRKDNGTSTIKCTITQVPNPPNSLRACGVDQHDQRWCVSSSSCSNSSPKGTEKQQVVCLKLNEGVKWYFRDEDYVVVDLATGYGTESTQPMVYSCVAEKDAESGG